MKTIKILLASLALVSVFGPASVASAVPFNIGCVGALNIDTSPATVVNCNVATVGFITDLDFYLEINDPDAAAYARDLQISLTHVATGTSVSIFVGLEPDLIAMIDGTFDDEALIGPAATGDILGDVQSLELLSAFNGLELSGTWRLTILDESAWQNEGIDLLQFRLQGNQVPEPGTGALLGMGLFGLTVFYRRKDRAPTATRESATH